MTQHLHSGRGAGWRRIFAASAMSLALAACAETQLGAQVAKSVARASGGDDAAPRNAAADPTLAPEAFEATGLTIWDGAATLQGVWFAHPLAQRAQRVRVSNLENDLVVEGALFRRDPSISGPSILVSSDAARALGLTPGSPTELQIVALREGPVETTPTATAAADPAPAPAPAAGAVETESLEAPTPAAAPAETETPPAQPESEIELAEVNVEETPVEPAPASEPTPEPAAEAPAPAPSPAPQPRPTQTAAATPAPTGTGPASAPLPAGSYLQIGSFGVELNAQALVDRLRAKGQPARYVNREVGGDPFSIVVIGPLSSPAEKDAAKAASAAEGQPNPLEITL